MGNSGIDGNSTSNPFTFSAGETQTNVQSAQLTLSSSVNPSDSTGQYGFKISGANEQTSLSGALTAGHYMDFSITAAPGFVLNLSSIEMNGQSSSTGAADVALLSTVDGFTSSSVIASVTGANKTGGFDTDTSGFGQAIDLTASKFQNLSSISFRIYGWNSTSGAGLTYLRNLTGNDLIINGSLVAVPEPSSTLPLGLAIASTLILRRKRRLRKR